MPPPTVAHAKRPTHKWTKEDRVALALLKKFYDNSNEELRQIFSYMAKDRLVSEGFTYDGLPVSRLVAQLTELKNGGTGSTFWRMVMDVPRSEARLNFAKQKNAIEEAALGVGIRLRLRLGSPTRVVTSSAATQATPGKLKPRAAARIGDWSESDDDEKETANTIVCKSPDDARKTSPGLQKYIFDSVEVPVKLKAFGPTLPQPHPQLRPLPFTQRLRERPYLQIRYDIHGNLTTRRPRLLFRAFEPTTGFRARRFRKTTAALPEPPIFNSQEFHHAVRPHLEYDMTYMTSPFISLTEGVTKALSIIAEVPESRDLAIFDYLEIEQDGRARYGEAVLPYPYLVPVVCKQHELFDLPRQYRGSGEHLCWASIECEPIAIFTQGEALRLLGFMKTMKAISAETGEALGHLIEDVPDMYKELVAYKLLRAFKVWGFSRCPDSEEYEEFADAVYSVTRGNRSVSVFSTLTCDRLTEGRRASGLEEEDSEGEPVEVEPAEIQNAQVDRPPPISNITWQPIECTTDGQLVSGAIVETLSPPRSSTQDLLDAQLMADFHNYGLVVDNTSSPATHSEPATPDSIVEMLNEAAKVPYMSSVPVSDEGSSTQPQAKRTLHDISVKPWPAHKAKPKPNYKSTTVVDLTPSDKETESRKKQVGRTCLIEDDSDIEEELAIIGVRTSEKTVLSIRSRSLSERVQETPTRKLKRAIKR